MFTPDYLQSRRIYQGYNRQVSTELKNLVRKTKPNDFVNRDSGTSKIPDFLRVIISNTWLKDIINTGV